MVQTLFALMAALDDTNLLHRGGPAGLDFVQAEARRFLDRGGVFRSDWRAEARRPPPRLRRPPPVAGRQRRHAGGGMVRALPAATVGAVMTLGILCPGQGAQHPDMLSMLDGEPAAEAVLAAAQAVLGRDLQQLVSQGGDEIHRNVVAQPLLCASQSRPGAPCATGCRPRASSPATASASLPPMPAPARSTPGKSWTWRGAVPRPWTGPARNRAACWRCAASPGSG